jgi:hypothetical protein
VGEYDHGYLYLPERAPPSPAPPEPCGPTGRWWVGATLALGWTAPARIPALVRLGGPTGPAAYGVARVSVPFRAGLGLAGGVWLDPGQTRGVDASFYYLAQATDEVTLFPGNAPLLVRATDAATGQPLFVRLAGPDVGIGAFQAAFDTRYLTADVNYRHNLLCGDRLRLDALFGYRFASVRETADLYGKSADPAGNLVRFRDTASAENHFHGGQVGLAGECRLDRWFLGFTGKVAFGTVFTETDLTGQYRMNAVVYPFGFYTRPTVAGRRESDCLAVMPTVGLILGRQLGEHARVFVGYDFQYLSRVVRPGDVIDPAPEAFGPGQRTRREVTTSDFWAQSVNLGAEVRY